jgi:hypothetical protein
MKAMAVKFGLVLALALVGAVGSAGYASATSLPCGPANDGQQVGGYECHGDTGLWLPIKLG